MGGKDLSLATACVPCAQRWKRRNSQTKKEKNVQRSETRQNLRSERNQVPNKGGNKQETKIDIIIQSTEALLFNWGGVQRGMRRSWWKGMDATNEDCRMVCLNKLAGERQRGNS